MAPRHTGRTVTLYVRMKPGLKRRLVDLAREGGESLAELVERVAETYLAPRAHPTGSTDEPSTH